MIDKSHMFWSGRPDVAYKDDIPIPRVTYRCTASVMRLGNTPAGNRKHECKQVTDHPGAEHACICGLEFNQKRTEQ